MNFYCQIAKKATEKYVQDKEILNLSEDTVDKFSYKRGVFVTIKKNGNLRACIGTYRPTKENVLQEIIDNAILAATTDYRFGPITIEELPHLSYEVYILGNLQKISNMKKLNPGKYGVVVEDKNFRRGLLLPGLEGINTVEKQIKTVCQKTGIEDVGEITVYRFKVKKYTSN